jgi:alkyldihydroxyacetonephosphate synthase
MSAAADTPVPTPQTSFWGWGHESKLPDEDMRRAVASHVARVLGVDPPEPRPLPRIEDIALPDARVTPPAELAGFSTAARRDRVTHTYGKSFRDQVRGFEGDFGPAPDFVSYPATEDEIGAVLAWASKSSVAVIPFGGGTSVVGGVEGAVSSRYEGVVSLDLGRMDRVLEVDAVSRAARIQAGARGPHIEAQLQPHDLSLRHYPQSFEFSTLGGWIATRAGGHFATLYTHIDDLVESIRMVTPAGELVSRRLPASGAGPSPDRLVLGSEGIFGVITEAWVRAQRRPRFRLQASVHFRGDMARAVDAVRAVSQAALYPTNCRLLSAEEAALNFVTDDGAHVLVLGFESVDGPRDDAMARAMALCEAHGGACPRGVLRREGEGKTAETAASAWRAAFLEAPYLQSALVSLGVIADTFETACTWDRFEALHARVTEAVMGTMRSRCGSGHLSLRFTHVYPDGPAPYYTFIAPGRPGEVLAQWEAIKRAAGDALLEMGATITHHHAVGRLHRPWYDRQRPPLFAAALRATKRAMDPAGIMNPGALLDP